MDLITAMLVFCWCSFAGSWGLGRRAQMTVREAHRSTGWEWLSLTERLESVWQTAVQPVTPVNGSISVKPPVISSRCTSRPVFSTGEPNRERLSEPITYTQPRFDSYKRKPSMHCSVCFVNINHFAHATHSVVCKRLKKGKYVAVRLLWMVCKPRVMQIICWSCFT